MDSFKETVYSVISKLFFKNNKWFVKVGFYSFGKYFETQLCFKSEKEAENVKIGYEFIF